MELLISLLVAAIVFALAYQLFFRAKLTSSQAGKRLVETMRVDDVTAKIDESSPEYKLAQAGIATRSPELTWLLMSWGAPAIAFAAALAGGFPITVALAAGFIGFILPRQWVEGRIKDRGRRLDEEIPKAYVRLLAVLRANPDVGLAITEVAETLELEKGGPTLLSTEFRIAAAEMANPDIGREEGLRRLQQRAASVSLSNLGLLLERFAQTGGDRFFGSFETAAENVQGILGARQRAQAKGAEQIQAARIIPGLMVLSMLFFMNDPGFASSFRLPVVQIALAVVAVLMFVGHAMMMDIAREAV